jgi:adenylate cyclase
VATKILGAVDEGSLKLGGEECVVTVLFADVRNFSGFSEKTNPQELVSILNRYLSLVIRAALQNEGMVNKFGGDSIMAIWNVPVTCPEHALLATKAAISAQQALRELQEKAKNLPKMEFGIGVNTGNVVAGNMGSADRLEYSVIGDAVNIAARLADAAPGGRIWIGSNTFALIKDYVSAVPLGALPLKGKSETIHAYEVVDTRNQPSDDREIEIIRIHQEEV